MTSNRLQPASILTATLLVLLVLFIPNSQAGVVKRSFVQLGCMGQYDKADFASLDRMCEECYNLYREPGLHSLCRSYCFKNDYFSGCIKALLLHDKEADILATANRLFGGP